MKTTSARFLPFSQPQGWCAGRWQFLGTDSVNLVEALEILKQGVPEDQHPLRVFLACGFTPLHLQTFLTAHLRKRLPQQRLELKTGLFGDLAGSIEGFQALECDILAVVIEWQDLDHGLASEVWVAGARQTCRTS